MKFRFFFLVTTFFITSFSYSQNIGTKDMIGTWTGTDSTNKTGTLKFIDSAAVIVSIPGWGVFNSSYNIDLDKKPMWFDIIIKNDEKIIILKGLLQFITNKEIKWQITFDEDRSKGFLPETSDNTQILKRQ